MIRRRQVLPDASGVVTREALIEAMISAADWLDFAGGVLSVVVQREATNLQGEMVTTGAVVEWRSKVRDQPGPGQFEQPSPIPEELPRVEARADTAAVERLAEQAEVEVLDDLVTPENPDGFDYSKLEEEDIEDEPAAAR